MRDRGLTRYHKGTIMKAYAKRCRAKFKRLDKLHDLIVTGTDPVGGRHVRKELADTWVKRQPSPGKYWNAKQARAVSRGL